MSSDVDVAPVWADCVIKIIGWFQISGNLNPATQLYMPETDETGLPISGPGWTAYEKPGANPGDIVVIYSLATIPSQGGSTAGYNLSSVLWDLINPGGLSYMVNKYSFKSLVNRSDIVSQFPHAGGSLSNAFDLIWSKVTTYYGLPGPGNVDDNRFIRRALPGFAIRVLVWTDSCCIANSITTLPPAPPWFPPPPFPPPPPIPPTNGTPNITTVDDNEGGGSVVNSGLSSSYAMEYQGSTERGSSGLGSGRPGDRPSPRRLSPISTRKKYQYRTPGSSPILWGFDSSINIKSYYAGEKHPAGYRFKHGEYDLTATRRAVPVGPDFILKSEKLIESKSLRKKEDHEIIAISKTVANSLGYNSLASLGSASNFVSTAKTNSIRGGSVNTSVPVRFSPGSNKSLSSNPDSPIMEGSIVRESTIGGFGNSVNSRPTPDGETDLVVFDGSQYRTSLIKSTNNPRGESDRRLGEKGSIENPSLGGLTKRTIDIKNGVRQSLYRLGDRKVKSSRYEGPNLSKVKLLEESVTYESIKDTSGVFDLSIMPLRNYGDIRGTPGFITVIKGNVSSPITVISQTTFTVHTKSGVASIGLGSVPIEFGMVNPVQPGMYAVANPACVPGQGSLPDIIAGDEVWSLAQLITTLLTIEGQVIAQQVYNVIPGPSGATDIVAPNRLPMGLMEALQISDSSNHFYEGSVSYGGAQQELWYKTEAHCIVERTVSNSNDPVSVVLKPTMDAMAQPTPFRPLMELYNDTVVLSAQDSRQAFVSGSCGATPGWWSPTMLTGYSAGGSHTQCPNGGGGTSAYVVDQNGVIITGPYNPGLYGGTHTNYQLFAGATAPLIASSTKYRIRVYNNGPYTDSNGYVLYGRGLRVSPPSGSLTIDSNGKLNGTVTTYHCNQLLKIRNLRTEDEITRYSEWSNGTIYLGNGPDSGANQYQPTDKLSVAPGDTIQIFRPGYGNTYSSRNLVAEIILP